jgi:hypothetical protein
VHLTIFPCLDCNPYERPRISLNPTWLYHPRTQHAQSAMTLRVKTVTQLFFAMAVIWLFIKVGLICFSCTRISKCFRLLWSTLHSRRSMVMQKMHSFSGKSSCTPMSATVLFRLSRAHTLARRAYCVPMKVVHSNKPHTANGFISSVQSGFQKHALPTTFLWSL